MKTTSVSVTVENRNSIRQLIHEKKDSLLEKCRITLKKKKKKLV